MTNRIDNNADLLDSRDIIARIAELEAMRDDYYFGPTEWATANPEDAEELAALSKLAEEAEGYAADWKYGETLVRDSYFKQYAMDYAYDIGALDKDYSWPRSCIDWDQAARELQYDYASVDFDGVTYWVR